MPPAVATETLRFLDCSARIHAHTDDFSLVEMLGVPARSMAPLHVHHDHDEGFYVLEGNVTLVTPGEEIVLEPGGFFLAPRGVPHTYRVGEHTSRWLCTSTPGHFAAFVVGVAGLPAPDPQSLAAVAADHGIELLGPPGTMP